MTEEHSESSTSESCEKRSFVVSSGSDSDDEEQFFSDFRGCGAPSGELGAIGDTYIDVDGKLLYARLADGWVRWPGPKKRSASLVHPTHSSFFLWCDMSKNRVSWMRKSKMKKIHASATDVVLRVLAAQIPKSKHLKRKLASEVPASDSDSDHAKRARVRTPTPTPAPTPTAPAAPAALAWRRCHVESPIPTSAPTRCPSADTPDQHRLPPAPRPISDFATSVSPRRSPTITRQTSLPRAAVVTNYLHTISSPILRWPEANTAPGAISGTALTSPIVRRSSSDTSSGNPAHIMVRPSMASPSVTASSGVTARSTSAISSSGRGSSMHVSPISPAQPLPLSLTPTLSPRDSHAIPSSPLPSLGSVTNTNSVISMSMANPASERAATQGLTNVAALPNMSVPTLSPRDAVRPMSLQPASGSGLLRQIPAQDRLAPRAAMLEAASIQQWESDRLRSQGSWDTSKLHLQTQNNWLKIKNDEITADREVMLGRLNELLHQRDAWIREREASQRVTRMANLQISDLTKQNSAFKLLNIHLTGENTALKNMIRDLRISNATLSTENATLAEQNTALRVENTERNNSLRRVVETIRRVKEDNEARKTRPEETETAAGQHPGQDEWERSTGDTPSTAVDSRLNENIVRIKEEQAEEPRVTKCSLQEGIEVIDLTLDSDDDENTRAHRSDKPPPVELVLSAATRNNQKPPSAERQRKPPEDVPEPNQHPREIHQARLLDTPSVLKPPTIEPSPSTPTHFLIAGTEFEHRQLVELVMHKGGAHCVTQEIWGQILMHLELIARQQHSDFEVPRSSWRDTTIALKDYYLRHLLHLERSNWKDVSGAIAVTPACSRHSAPSIHPHPASPTTVHQPQDHSANIASGQHNQDAPSESLRSNPAGDSDGQVADVDPQTATNNSIEVDNNAPAAEQTPGDPISNTPTDEAPGIEPETTANHPRNPDDMALADENNELDLSEIERSLRVQTEDIASPVDESAQLLEHRDTLDEQTGTAEVPEDPLSLSFSRPTSSPLICFFQLHLFQPRGD
ncbi:hypothetical protein DFH06DRAFT_434518 [Mycena polygramma]|nr:hypothetical protein DFH06DRAFT_434518 [Mycena polygramma]